MRSSECYTLYFHFSDDFNVIDPPIQRIWRNTDGGFTNLHFGSKLSVIGHEERIQFHNKIRTIKQSRVNINGSVSGIHHASLLNNEPDGCTTSKNLVPLSKMQSLSTFFPISSISTNDSLPTCNPNLLRRWRKSPSSNNRSEVSFISSNNTPTPPKTPCGPIANRPSISSVKRPSFSVGEERKDNNLAQNSSHAFLIECTSDKSKFPTHPSINRTAGCNDEVIKLSCEVAHKHKPSTTSSTVCTLPSSSTVNVDDSAPKNLKNSRHEAYFSNGASTPPASSLNDIIVASPSQRLSNPDRFHQHHLSLSTPAVTNTLKLNFPAESRRYSIGANNDFFPESPECPSANSSMRKNSNSMRTKAMTRSLDSSLLNSCGRWEGLGEAIFGNECKDLGLKNDLISEKKTEHLHHISINRTKIVPLDKPSFPANEHSTKIANLGLPPHSNALTHKDSRDEDSKYKSKFASYSFPQASHFETPDYSSHQTQFTSVSKWKTSSGRSSFSSNHGNDFNDSGDGVYNNHAKGSLSSSGHLENPSKNRQSRMMNGIKLPNFPLLNNPSSSLNEGASLPNVSMSKTTISAKASAAQDDYVMKGGIDALSKAVEAMYINERGEKFDRARLGLVGQKLSEKTQGIVSNLNNCQNYNNSIVSRNFENKRNTAVVKKLSSQNGSKIKSATPNFLHSGSNEKMSSLAMTAQFGFGFKPEENTTTTLTFVN